MYKSLVFGDEFLAHGLHLKSHQRCSAGIRTLLSAKHLHFCVLRKKEHRTCLEQCLADIFSLTIPFKTLESEYINHNLLNVSVHTCNHSTDFPSQSATHVNMLVLLLTSVKTPAIPAWHEPCSSP